VKNGKNSIPTMDKLLADIVIFVHCTITITTDIAAMTAITIITIATTITVIIVIIIISIR
jgi:hypothetical protein